VNVDGLVAIVSELFQSTIRQVESPEASDLNPGDVFFGFSGKTESAQLLVRWNANYINFFQGVAVQEKEVVAAFASPPGK
jgi:nicotinate-nucleotide pyrophosphorylase